MDGWKYPIDPSETLCVTERAQRAHDTGPAPERWVGDGRDVGRLRYPWWWSRCRDVFALRGHTSVGASRGRKTRMRHPGYASVTDVTVMTGVPDCPTVIRALPYPPGAEDGAGLRWI
jgi:hypothetical protein